MKRDIKAAVQMDCLPADVLTWISLNHSGLTSLNYITI